MGGERVKARGKARLSHVNSGRVGMGKYRQKLKI